MNPGISQNSSATPSANDWLGHTARLIGWNLRLARRRLMSKILLALLLVGFLLLVGGLLLTYVVVDNIPQQSTCAPTPVSTSQPTGVGSGSDQPCVSSSQQAQQAQQDFANADRALLTFPMVLEPAGDYTAFLGVILLCILAGALIGSEYSFGTQRLALSRGVSRAQLLAAQIGALAILALAVAAGMFILGALVGLTIGPLLGGSIPNIPPTGWLEILGFWLVVSLHLFAYALIALCLATLGRSTVAGIAGSLGYLLFETIALPIILLLAAAASGSLTTNITNIQDVFLGPNLSGLQAGVTQTPIDLGAASSGSGTPGDLVIAPVQGLLVSLLYCAILIGLSYWALRKRDVTN